MNMIILMRDQFYYFFSIVNTLTSFMCIYYDIQLQLIHICTYNECQRLIDRISDYTYME